MSAHITQAISCKWKAVVEAKTSGLSKLLRRTYLTEVMASGEGAQAVQTEVETAGAETLGGYYIDRSSKLG
jgi:hypothetical protein